MVADMLSNKTLNVIVVGLFIRGRKLNIYLLLSHNLNSTCYFVMKIPNKRELQQIAFHHSPDIDFKDYMKL